MLSIDVGVILTLFAYYVNRFLIIFSVFFVLVLRSIFEASFQGLSKPAFSPVFFLNSLPDGHATDRVFFLNSPPDGHATDRVFIRRLSVRSLIFLKERFQRDLRTDTLSKA